MADRTPQKSATVTKKAAAKPVTAKAGKPHKAVARSSDDMSTSKENDKKIAAPGDWKAETLARMRALIIEADPGITEDVKWRKPSNSMMGVPVWSSDGIICTGETYKDKVKLTFAKGASLEDPAGLFNASLEGGTRRAIDLYEGDAIDEEAFKSLVSAAAALNASARG